MLFLVFNDFTAGLLSLTRTLPLPAQPYHAMTCFCELLCLMDQLDSISTVSLWE